MRPAGWAALSLLGVAVFAVTLAAPVALAAGVGRQAVAWSRVDELTAGTARSACRSEIEHDAAQRATDVGAQYPTVTVTVSAVEVFDPERTQYGWSVDGAMTFTVSGGFLAVPTRVAVSCDVSGTESAPVAVVGAGAG